MEEYFPRTEISLPENIKEIFRKGLPISQSLPLSDDMINQLLSSQTIILVGHTYKLLE
jgi:hypothetical protein